MLITFLTGATLALSIAAPPGPIALLCLQRSVTRGAPQGIVTGLGAAAAHAGFFALASSGAVMAAAWMDSRTHLLHAAAAVILVLLGLRILIRRRGPIGTPQAAAAASLPVAFTTAMLLALSNPMTIIPYAAASTVVSVGVCGLPVPAIAGVAAGAASWYASLAIAGALLRHRMTPAMFRWFDRVAAVLLIGLGLAVGLA